MGCSTALRVFRSLVQTRHRQGFTCGWAGLGTVGGGAADEEQVHMVGSLPFIPAASDVQSEEGTMGNKESDAIISDMKREDDSEEVVLIQYRLTMSGREIRAQVRRREQRGKG